MKDWLVARIEKALAHGLGTHTFDDVVRALAAGEFQIFHNEGAVCITEIKQTPRKKFLQIFLVAGRLQDLKALQPEVLQFGRDQGCDFVLGGGRMGWQKVATPGWDKQWVVHKYDLS